MGGKPGDPRNTAAWRRLRARVVAEEPLCWLGYAGICTKVSTTGDHVIPIDLAPHLALERSNCRGCCSPCNREKSNRLIGANEPAQALSFFD